MSDLTRFQSGGNSVRSLPPHAGSDILNHGFRANAPIVNQPPGDQAVGAFDLLFPISGAACGAIWSLIIAAIVGFHPWEMLPIIALAACGEWFRRAG